MYIHDLGSCVVGRVTGCNSVLFQEFLSTSSKFSSTKQVNNTAHDITVLKPKAADYTERSTR